MLKTIRGWRERKASPANSWRRQLGGVTEEEEWEEEY
jgi:hypothetical protein